MRYDYPLKMNYRCFVKVCMSSSGFQLLRDIKPLNTAKLAPLPTQMEPTRLNLNVDDVSEENQSPVPQKPRSFFDILQTDRTKRQVESQVVPEATIATHYRPSQQQSKASTSSEPQRPSISTSHVSHQVQHPKPYKQLSNQEDQETNVYDARGVYEGTNEVGILAHDQASTFTTEPVAVHLTVDGREMPLTTSLRTVGIGGLV